VIESRVHVKKNRRVTIAARYVSMSFAEDMSTGLLSSSSIGGSQDIRHINDNNDNDDDDVIISNSQQASAVQAPAIATHGSRWNRVGRRVGNGGEGKGSKTVAFGKGVGGAVLCRESEVVSNHHNSDNDSDNDDDDVCTVWSSCVAGNPVPLRKVQGQVLGAQPYDGLFRQEYLIPPPS